MVGNVRPCLARAAEADAVAEPDLVAPAVGLGAGQPGQAVSEGDVAADRDLEVAVLDLEAAAPGREPGIQPVDPGLLRHQRRRQRVHHEPVRSEEHTSELQPLMRTSYAVFCLQTKTKTQDTNHTPKLNHN